MITPTPIERLAELSTPSASLWVKRDDVQALRGEPISVQGDGSQLRCFCYVDDLVGGLLALMERPVFDGPVGEGDERAIS